MINPEQYYTLPQIQGLMIIHGAQGCSTPNLYKRARDPQRWGIEVVDAQYKVRGNIVVSKWLQSPPLKQKGRKRKAL